MVKDSVSGASDSNDISHEYLKKIEKSVAQFLGMPLFASTKQSFGRKLFAYVYERAIFNDDDDTICNVCVKSNDGALLDRLLKILHKFKLYDLLDRSNCNHETGVHVACAMNKANALHCLMKYGAGPNAIDSNGDTALHIAIQTGNDDCVSTLLSTTSIVPDRQMDVDLNVLSDVAGVTPLHLAASMQNGLNIVEMLQFYAAKKQCRSIFDDVDGRHGNNALHIAILSNANDVAEYLIQNKCISPFKTNRSGQTAFDLARIGNATYLIDLMAQPTTVNGEHLADNVENNDASFVDSFYSQDTHNVRMH